MQNQTEKIYCQCGYDRESLSHNDPCPECGEDFVQTYTLVSSWKCSSLFPAKITFCCSVLTSVFTIVLLIMVIGLLTNRGFGGGTAGFGLVLMYIPVFGIAIFGFVLNCIVLFVRRRQCEKKLAILNLLFSVIPLLPALLLLLQIIRVLLGFG